MTNLYINKINDYFAYVNLILCLVEDIRLLFV